MNNYLDAVQFSELPKDEVQKLLVQYIKNTQPDSLKFNPKIMEYSDTKIVFWLQKHYGRMSLSVDLLLKNINSKLNSFGEEILNYTYSNDFLKMKVGNINYLDIDILSVSHFAIIIRVDSITRLISGGIKQFVEYKDVYGATNGRLFIMSEMRDNPIIIDHLYTDILQPKGFEAKKDFVYGYSSLYAKKDNWKPIEWCIVSWLESIITPSGLYVKFLKMK